MMRHLFRKRCTGAVEAGDPERLNALDQLASLSLRTAMKAS